MKSSNMALTSKLPIAYTWYTPCLNHDHTFTPFFTVLPLSKRS